MKFNFVQIYMQYKICFLYRYICNIIVLANVVVDLKARQMNPPPGNSPVEVSFLRKIGLTHLFTKK